MMAATSACPVAPRKTKMKIKSILIILAVVIIAIVIFAIYYYRCVLIVYDREGMVNNANDHVYSDTLENTSVSEQEGDE